MTDDPLGAWLRETSDADARAPHAQAVPAGDGRVPQPDGRPTESSGDRVAALFADERLPAAPSRRRPLLWLLASLPWLVVAVLLLARGGEAPTRGAVSEPPLGESEGPGSGDSQPGEILTASLPDDRLLAAAAVAVRTGATASDGLARRYVDTVAAESVMHHGEIAIVTVRAVVLDGTADRWLRARPARFAVPVGTAEGEVVALAEPWVLAPPKARPGAPAWRPLADRSLAAEAVATLRKAGYRAIAPARLSVRDDLAGIVRSGVRARAPGERTVRRHRVWLTDTSPPQLLGASPPESTLPPPSPSVPNPPAPSPSTAPEPLEQP